MSPEAGMPRSSRDESAVWERVVGISIPEVRIAIVEAFRWIGMPLSPANLNRLLDHGWSLNLIAHHVNALSACGLLMKADSRPVRGSQETFYVIAA